MPETTTSDLDAERAALADARLRAEASAALNAAGCQYVELFTPLLVQRLRLDAGRVLVLDDEGAVRRHVTPAQLAQEVRARYEARNRGGYFR